MSGGSNLSSRVAVARGGCPNRATLVRPVCRFAGGLPACPAGGLLVCWAVCWVAGQFAGLLGSSLFVARRFAGLLGGVLVCWAVCRAVCWVAWRFAGFLGSLLGSLLLFAGQFAGLLGGVLGVLGACWEAVWH